MISVDALTKKELKKQPVINPQTKNFSCVILHQIQQFQNPSKIAKNLGITEQRLQYHLDKLKHAGLIRKLGYATWEVVDDEPSPKNETKKTARVGKVNPQTNLKFFMQDAVRAHAFVFTLKIPENLRNWNNNTRARYLWLNDIEWKDLTTFGGGERIMFKGRKIWLTNKSVIVYEKSSYLADIASNAKSYAIYNFISLIKSLERVLHADFTVKGGRHYEFKVSRQHYALVKNALAQQYDAEGKKLKVFTSTKNLWFVIDNSFNLHEAETVHSQTADSDNEKVQAFFNSLKEYPLTTDFILEAMNGIQQNQMLFAQNIRTHVKAIQDLDLAARELTRLIKQLQHEQPESQTLLKDWSRGK